MSDGTAGPVTHVCDLQALLPERAVAAIVGGTQIALVRLLDDRVYAVGQWDPFCQANVISRGIVGSARVGDVDVPTIQSPMYKQAFDLRDGRCLSDPGVRLGSWRVEVAQGHVGIGEQLSSPAGLGPGEVVQETAHAASRAREAVEGSP